MARPGWDGGPGARRGAGGDRAARRRGHPHAHADRGSAHHGGSGRPPDWSRERPTGPCRGDGRARRHAIPLTALHLLWMSLVTDVVPALALAMEPGEPLVMRQPPRPPGEPLLTRSMWRIIGREMSVIAGTTLGSYLWGLGRYGAGAHARTLAFSTITMSQIAYASACRTEGRGN